MSDTARSLLTAFRSRMAEIAHEWRMDWSDFDGRTLVAQVAEEAKPVDAWLAAHPAELEPSDEQVDRATEDVIVATWRGLRSPQADTIDALDAAVDKLMEAPLLAERVLSTVLGFSAAAYVEKHDVSSEAQLRAALREGR